MILAAIKRKRLEQMRSRYFRLNAQRTCLEAYLVKHPELVKDWLPDLLTVVGDIEELDRNIKVLEHEIESQTLYLWSYVIGKTDPGSA